MLREGAAVVVDERSIAELRAGRSIMINRRPLQEAERQNLLRAAYHEAGHDAVARHFGVQGQIRITPYIDADGLFAFFGWFSPSFTPADPYARTMIGLAGVCVEAVMGEWKLAAPLLARGMMSPTDLALAGDEFDDGDVVEALGLVEWLWGDVESCAREAARPWLLGPLVASGASATDDSGDDSSTFTETDRGARTPAHSSLIVRDSAAQALCAVATAGVRE